jgi:hypothetical protein
MAREKVLECHQHGPLVIDDQDAMIFCFHSIALLVLRTTIALQLLKPLKRGNASNFLGSLG